MILSVNFKTFLLYFILRYLLCGQTVTGDLAFTPAKEDNRLSSAGSAGATVVPATPPVGTPVITLSPLTVDTRTAGSHAVQVSQILYYLTCF
jgi:hypothetical protein